MAKDGFLATYYSLCCQVPWAVNDIFMVENILINFGKLLLEMVSGHVCVVTYIWKGFSQYAVVAFLKILIQNLFSNEYHLMFP